MTKTVICDLCPKSCRIPPNGLGDCKVRYNDDGTLISLIYERPSAIHVDPVEKKPLFHVLPGTKAFSIATTGCNLHCKNCQNYGLSQVEPMDRKAYFATPKTIVKTAIEKKCSSVAMTYTDPVIFYEYAVDVGEAAIKNNLLSLWITAGFISPQPLKKALNTISAVNLDIKSMKNSFYRDICDATLKPVLDTAIAIKNSDTWLELTYLVIPSLNDTEKDFKKLSNWIVKNLGKEVPLHFSRFFPHYKLRNIPPTPIDTLLKGAQIARGSGIKFVYVGNVRRDMATENTSCPHCGFKLIERYGYNVIQNNIIEGKCKKCGNKIPGIWK